MKRIIETKLAKEQLNRRLSVHVTKTINIGNFESIKIGASLSQDISDSDDSDDKYNEFFDEVLFQINRVKKDLKL